MINIVPFHGVYNSCLEDVIATIANWKDSDCFFMYAGAWNFKLSKESEAISKRLRLGNTDYAYYLEKHHGISLNWNVYASDDQLETVISEVTNNRPVVIRFDSFDCTWHTYYRKQHSLHYCVLIGVTQNSFQCLDSYLTLDVVELSIKDFIASCREYALVSIHPIKNPFYESYNSIMSSIDKAMNREKNIFEQMHLFAQEIISSSEVLNEINQTEDLLESTIIEKIKFIGLGRRNYAQLIHKIGENFSVDNLIDMAADIDKLAQNWERVKWLLVKCKMVQNQRKILNDISNVMEEIAEVEREQMIKLWGIIQAMRNRFH